MAISKRPAPVNPPNPELIVYGNCQVKSSTAKIIKKG